MQSSQIRRIWSTKNQRFFVSSKKSKIFEAKRKEIFVFLSLVKAEKITTVDKILVHQRRNVKTSLSQTREKDPLCFYDAIKALNEELIKANLFSEVEPSFVNGVFIFVFGNWITMKNLSISFQNLKI